MTFFDIFPLQRQFNLIKLKVLIQKNYDTIIAKSKERLNSPNSLF